MYSSLKLVTLFSNSKTELFHDSEKKTTTRLVKKFLHSRQKSFPSFFDIYIYIYTDKKNVCDARVFSRMEKLFDDSEIRFTMDPAGKMYHGRSKVGDFPYPSKL